MITKTNYTILKLSIQLSVSLYQIIDLKENLRHLSIQDWTNAMILVQLTLEILWNHQSTHNPEDSQIKVLIAFDRLVISQKGSIIILRLERKMPIAISRVRTRIKEKLIEFHYQMVFKSTQDRLRKASFIISFMARA